MKSLNHKISLRQSMISQISKLSLEEIERLSQKLNNFLEQVLINYFPGHQLMLGVCSPLPGEPKPNFDNLLAKNYQLAFPREERPGVMDFYLCRPKDLIQDFWGKKKFFIPPNHSPKVIPNALVIPALGFDPHGFRLGRGGGYFDQYLSRNKNAKILCLGIAFSFQIINHPFATDLDIPMDIIVTEKEILGPFAHRGSFSGVKL